MHKLLAFLLLSPTLVFAAQTLNGAEISALFSGNTSQCIKQKDQSKCSTFMSPDGKIKRHMQASGKQRTGQWEVVDNKLCITWEGKTKALCFDVVAIEDGQYQLLKKGDVKSIVTGFKPGDHSGF